MHQLKKQEPHGDLVDAPLIRLVIEQCPDHVFHQILHREHISHLEMQKAGVPGVIAQAAHQEIPQQIFLLPHHLKGGIKKLRQNDEVHSDIALSGRQNLLGGMLV